MYLFLLESNQKFVLEAFYAQESQVNNSKNWIVLDSNIQCDVRKDKLQTLGSQV